MNDHLVHFTPIEYNILLLFISNRGKVLTHKYLQSQIWGYDTLDDYQAYESLSLQLGKRSQSMMKIIHISIQKLVSGIGLVTIRFTPINIKYF